MSGTKEGGAKAAATNKAKYGEDFYRNNGRIGGSRGAKDGAIKGFAQNRELARIAGAKGGRNGRRGPNKKYDMVTSATDRYINDFQEGFNQPTWKDKILARIK